MKPTLTHMSRSAMKRMLRNNEVPENTLIISINDTVREMNEIRDLVDNKFLISSYSFKDDGVDFTHMDAVDILTEVSISKATNILVHCFLGVSRSAAVAKWVNDYLKLDMQKYNEYRQHNLHVYDTLCKVSGVENINNYYRNLEKQDD